MTMFKRGMRAGGAHLIDEGEEGKPICKIEFPMISTCKTETALFVIMFPMDTYLSYSRPKLSYYIDLCKI